MYYKSRNKVPAILSLDLLVPLKTSLNKHIELLFH